MATTYVIARYNEPLTWINPDKTKVRYCIYNKGSTPTPIPSSPLPNVGRETHTYLYHIISEYDRLNPDEVTIFTQGEPHIPNKWNMVSTYFNVITYESRKYGVSKQELTNSNEHWGAHYNLRLHEWTGHKLVPTKHNECFGQWFKRCVGRPLPSIKQVFWVPCACFVVKNERILAKPKAYYEMLIDEVSRDCNTEAAHFFERAWYSIFSE